MKLKQLAIWGSVLLLVAGCSGGSGDKALSETEIRELVSKHIQENPNIVFDVIKDNPVVFWETMETAANEAKETFAKRKQEEQVKQMEKMVDHTIDNPLQPTIRDDEAIRGVATAPLVLVEYSDFECPYCARGSRVVEQLREKYGDQLQSVYKHNPLKFHKQAANAARYYEAIRLQDAEKAFKFHDELFADQAGLKKGDAFFEEMAKKVGADTARLAKDLKSDAVAKRIAEDVKEAASFGFDGTPAFILNGVPIKGAYPLEHFEMIIGKLQAKGKVALK
jgi:protein-disulfide isomerase